MRDVNSFRFAPVVQFTQGAIIEGQASAGFRDFRPARPPPGTRTVASWLSVTLGFTLLNITRLEVQASNDVQFSYDDTHPLYLGAGGRVTLAQRVAGPFEAIVIGGRQRLRYQSAERLLRRPWEYVTARAAASAPGNEHLRVTLTVDREQRGSKRSVRRDYTRRRLRVRQLHPLRPCVCEFPRF